MRLFIGDRTVNCDCDTSFHTHVLLDPTGSNWRVDACMKCGTASYVTAGVEENRGGHQVLHGYMLEPLDEETLSWLGLWPRVAIEWLPSPWPLPAQLARRRLVYFPASERFDTPEAFRRAVAAPAPARDSLRHVTRLNMPPAPQGLPRELATFAWTQRKLASLCTCSREELMEAACGPEPVATLALEKILLRGDQEEILHAALAGGTQAPGLGIRLARLWPDKQAVGGMLARGLAAVSDGKARDPDNPDDLEALERMWDQAQALMLAMLERGIATPEACEALRAFRDSVPESLTWVRRTVTTVQEKLAAL